MGEINFQTRLYKCHACGDVDDRPCQCAVAKKFREDSDQLRAELDRTRRWADIWKRYAKRLKWAERLEAQCLKILNNRLLKGMTNSHELVEANQATVELSEKLRMETNEEKTTALAELDRMTAAVEYIGTLEDCFDGKELDRMLAQMKEARAIREKYGFDATEGVEHG